MPLIPSWASSVVGCGVPLSTLSGSPSFFSQPSHGTRTANVSQQCRIAASTGNQILGVNNRYTTFKKKIANYDSV